MEKTGDQEHCSPRLEIKSIAVPCMHILEFGREKCSLTTSAGKNCIFPYRETSKVKLWLRSRNSGNALLGCPGITIIHYQSFMTNAKVSPAKSVGKKFGRKNAVWAYQILLPLRSLKIMQQGTAMLLISSLFYPLGWKRVEIKSIAVPCMLIPQLGRQKCIR